MELLVGIAVSKTNNDPLGNDKEDHEVDAISGATITGDGVTDMISERLAHYTPYFKRSSYKISRRNYGRNFYRRSTIGGSPNHCLPKLRS